MADRPIRIKSFSQKATGSLARRVLYGSLALLGLPLLIHTFFLYKREYNLNVQDAFESLGLLAESRALYIDQLIRNQQNLLEALFDDLPFGNVEREAFLAEEASQFKSVERFIYADIENGRVLCEDIICQNPTYNSFLQQAVLNDRFVFINPFSKEKHYDLVVCKTVPSRELPTALFCAISNASQMLENLTLIEDSEFPLRLSLINKEGLIFLSTEEGFVGKKLAESTRNIEWTPYERVKGAWYLETPEKSSLAVKIAIEGTGYELLVDVPEKSIADLQWNSYFFRIGSFILFVCLFGGAIVFWFTHRVSKPLRALGEAMTRISQGALHVRFEPDPMGFEINAIGLQLNSMLDALLAHQQEAERERIARERLAEELKIGQKIQASMLPTSLPDFPELNLASGYLAAREVSGDFYDFYRREDGKLFIAIADAADKGISACLYSLSFRSMLRTAAATMDNLASISKTANQLLMCDTLESNFFITAWIGLYNPKTKLLQYCSHGHPPAYLQRVDGDLEQLSTAGMALGVQETEPQVEKKVLREGDLLFLYTDGVIEAHDPDRQLFGKERLQQFLRRCKSGSAERIVDELLQEIQLFCRDAPQADDLTLVAMIQK